MPHVKEEMMSSGTVVNNKKRKTKALPEGLLKLHRGNFRKALKARLETDSKEPGEVMVAYEVVVVEGDNTEKKIVLDELTLDQLRMLCRKIGVRYVNNCTKFQCRKALWRLANVPEPDPAAVVVVAAFSDTMTSNIVRIANILLSQSPFWESFRKLKDHQTGETFTTFWRDVADAVNGSNNHDDNNDNDNSATALQVILAEDDPHYDKIQSINLQHFDVMTDTVIRKKVLRLVKVRKEIQNMLSSLQSGEPHDRRNNHNHNHKDPYNYVHVAMKKVGGSALTPLGCYYFYKLCDQNPQVDATFAQGIDAMLKGPTDATTTTIPSKSNEPGMKDKKRAYAAMVEFGKTAKTIAEEMKQSNKLAKQSQLISLAQHLGKREILEQLFESVASSLNDD